MVLVCVKHFVFRVLEKGEKRLSSQCQPLADSEITKAAINLLCINACENTTIVTCVYIMHLFCFLQPDVISNDVFFVSDVSV